MEPNAYRLDMFAAGFSDYQKLPSASTLELRRLSEQGLSLAIQDIGDAPRVWHHKDHPGDALYRFRTERLPIPREDLQASVSRVRDDLRKRKLAPKGRWVYTLYVAENDTEGFWVGVRDVCDPTTG